MAASQYIDLPKLGTAVSIALPAAYLLHGVISARLRRSRRAKVVPVASERVLVLGASSGIGRALVKQYAARGARVCAVARRAEQLASLAQECGPGAAVMCEKADFSSVDDMVRVRERLVAEWGGLDSVHICAGVSALQPLMTLAGVGEKSVGVDATGDGIKQAVDLAGRATQGNFVGPLVAVVALLPMMIRTSASPSILLVSSVAAIIPAPTRALYAATKAASLLLFQALAIEQPQVAFSFMLPATIEGDFRAGAVDSHLGGVRESDPNKIGLKRDYVAKRCIDAVDQGTRGNIVLPWFPYAIAQHLYNIIPSFIEARARRKYNFKPA